MTATRSPDRVQAPFGRRAVAITARTQYGPYVVLSCADPDGPRPRAGQFYMLSAARRWGGGQDERPFLPRAFSVLRAPAGTAELQFMLEDVGPGTQRLCELRPADEMLLVGPLGNGFIAPREGRRALLVGGGVGTAPLAILQDVASAVADSAKSAGADSDGRNAVESADADPIGAILPAVPRVLLGFRDAIHAAGAQLLADPRVATDDGSVGHHGLVTDLLTHALDRDPHVEVFACGPPAMLEAVRALCVARHVPAQLALESGMACGYGACFGCVVPTRGGYLRLCVDGPVLDAAQLERVVP